MVHNSLILEGLLSFHKKMNIMSVFKIFFCTILPSVVYTNLPIAMNMHKETILVTALAHQWLSLLGML